MTLKLADADIHAHWRKALELGQGRELTRPQQSLVGIHEGHPECGYYRKRSLDGPDTAVAIWIEGEAGMLALDGDSQADPVRVWTFCCRWPISYEQYQAVAVRGEPWPDDGPAPVAGIGDNMPDDPHERAKIEFAAEKEAARKFLEEPITTQERADRAAVWASNLAKMFKEVDDMFTAEKRPILDAGVAVGNKYRWREEINQVARNLTQHQTKFLQEKQRKADEERRRLQREADEAAAKAAEAAEKASLQNSDEGRAEAAAEADRLANDAAVASRTAAAAPERVSAGRTGAKSSLTTVWFAHVLDYDKLIMALKDSPDVKAAVMKVADSIARGKGPVVDGMERRSRQEARR